MTNANLDVNSVLDQAVAEAQAEHDNQPTGGYSMADAVDQVPAVAPVYLPQNTPNVATFVAAPKQSLFDEDEPSEGLVVEMWLKPTPGGVVVEKTPIEELLVTIRLDDTGIAKHRCITYGPDKESKRSKTYGRGPNAVVDVGDGKGRNWLEFCASIQTLYSDCKGDYPSADLSFKTVNDIQHKLGNIPTGTYVGHSASKTSWRAVDLFLRKCKDAGLLGQEVYVKLSGKENSYNGNNWNTLTMELVGPVDVD
jgi:hypothetical protein